MSKQRNDKRERPELVEGFGGWGDVSDFVRGAIYLSHMQGATYRDIGASLGVAPSTAVAVVTECKNGKFFRTYDGYNDEQETPETVVKCVNWIKGWHHRNKNLTTAQAREKLWVLKGIEVSHRTVQRYFAQTGAQHMALRRVCKLSPDQKQMRVIICKAWLKKYPEGHVFWTNILFSDESKKGCTDMDAHQWVPEGDEPDMLEVDRWATRLHVWGYIGPNGSKYLTLLPPGTVGSKEYTKTLQHSPLKKNNKVSDTYIFQQDGAAAHTAKTTREWMETNLNNETLSLKNEEFWQRWPAASPDLSPIENLWAVLWKKVADMRPKDDTQMWKYTKKVWDSFDETFLNKFLSSFRRRVLRCVAINGDAVVGY